MTSAFVLAGAFLVQLAAKSALALRLRRRESVPPACDWRELTVLQPVVSGDPELEQILRADRAEFPGATFLWAVDRTDPDAIVLCRRLAAQFPSDHSQILETEEPPPACNPKMWKQHLALPLVRTRWLAVVDDDTRVTRRGMEQLIKSVDDGAMLATGLPCYVPARGFWSGLVTEFVNSAASLTYLPAAALAEPVSINGMCYLARTETVRRHGLFENLRVITDDLGVARAVRAAGGRIVQTTQPQFISTTVHSSRHFARLMHRWFVFIRVLLQRESLATRACLLGALLAPALCFWGALGLAWWQAAPVIAALFTLALLAVRSLVIAAVNRRLTGAVRHRPLASLAMEACQGVFLLSAWLHPVIWWRKRRIRVRSYDDFDYLPS